MIQILLIIVGFAMLVKGADWFVDGAAGIAAKFGIPQLVIGLTVVAMGTSAPEAAVSIAAAMKHNADISVGNIVGSNILNILIILGITAVVTKVAVSKSTIWIEIPFMIAVTAILALMGFTDESINLVEGIMLWVLFIVYLVYMLYMAKKGKAAATEQDEHLSDKPFAVMVVMAVVGCVIVVWGSDITVDAATKLAKMAGISQRFIGLTIVALGTSLPELVTSVTAAIKKNADIAIGNIVGSNIFNILFVLGTTALITPVPYRPGFIIDTVIAILAGVLLWAAVVKTNHLNRVSGSIMLLSYAGYFTYLMIA